MVDASAVTYTASGTGAVQRTVEDKLNEALSVIDFGADPTGASSSTAAFDDAVAAAVATGNRRVYIPTGTYRFMTRPATISSPVVIEGDGTNATVLYRMYTESGGASAGFISFGPGSSGSVLSNCAIETGDSRVLNPSNAKYTGGSIISIVSTGSFSVGNIVLEDLWVTTEDSRLDNCLNTLYIDGSAHSSGSIGNAIRDCQFFGANGYSAVLKSVSGLSWHGGGAFQAGGTHGHSGSLFLTGVSTVRSGAVALDISSCRSIWITYTNYALVRISVIGTDGFGFGINNDTTAVNIAASAGVITGTVTSSWTSSGVYRPTGWSAT